MPPLGLAPQVGGKQNVQRAAIEARCNMAEHAQVG